MSEIMEVPVMNDLQSTINLREMDELKGKTVGDKVEITIKGTVKAVRESADWKDGKETGKKHLSFDIEMDSKPETEEGEEESKGRKEKIKKEMEKT